MHQPSDATDMVIHEYSLADSISHRTEIIAAFEQLIDDPGTEKSHLFNGRYENIYPQRDKIPQVEPLIQQIRLLANDILDVKRPLSISFWFNLMHKGHTTTLHTHDTSDELLSGVFYLQVPQNSGDIEFHLDNKLRTITPVAGDLFLFSPSLPHAVSENRSQKARLSLAFNLGVKEDA